MLCLIRIVLFGLIFTGMTFVAAVRGMAHSSHAQQAGNATATLHV